MQLGTLRKFVLLVLTFSLFTFNFSIDRVEANTILRTSAKRQNKSTPYSRLIETAKNTGELLAEKSPVPFSPSPKSSLKITIDNTKKYQKIVGFGGAFTEAAAVTLQKMNPALQEQVMEAYFGENGNKYTVCRTHINSCDFCVSVRCPNLKNFQSQSYNFDDVSNDFSLTHFNVSHDTKTLIPMIKSAFDVFENTTLSKSASLKVFASPWSPPGWMKENDAMDWSFKPGLKSGTEYHQVWAQYFVRYLEEYSNHGVKIWGITIQNEPLFAAPWEACCYDGTQEMEFLRDYLGPALKASYPDLQIIIYDHNKDKNFVDFVKAVMSDEKAKSYVDSVGVHWYDPDSQEFQHLDTVHDLYSDVSIMATEACEGPGVKLGDWGRGEHYGRDMIGDLENWVVSWTDWNMVLDQQGGPNHLDNYCDAPIICDTESQVVYYQIPYYYMGQISRFALPESYRIDSQPSSATSMHTVSFETPKSEIVVVVMNEDDTAHDFDIEYKKSYLHTSIPEHAIQTYVFAA